tara:strand:+ start:495 stop:650 length:156 start_codon:yes stop_codon:yes gene_type:complete
MEMKRKMPMRIKKMRKRRKKIMMKMRKSLTQFAKLMGFLKREKVLMVRSLN